MKWLILCSCDKRGPSGEMGDTCWSQKLVPQNEQEPRLNCTPSGRWPGERGTPHSSAPFGDSPHWRGLWVLHSHRRWLWHPIALRGPIGSSGWRSWECVTDESESKVSPGLFESRKQPKPVLQFAGVHARSVHKRALLKPLPTQGKPREWKTPRVASAQNLRHGSDRNKRASSKQARGAQL